MNNLKPINQTKLFGLDKYISELIQLYKNSKLPNKILLSGPKGLGKSTLAFHFINFILSQNEDSSYDAINFVINAENHSFKTVINGSNLNFFLIDIDLKYKSINIDQIRDLISQLNKSSLNNKPRFILIDNIEFLNINSINALLKVLEEPSSNIYFILINNNKKILPTLLSRCINFKFSLTNQESKLIASKLLGEDINEFINDDLINYYISPGNLYNLIKFGIDNDYDLKNLKLDQFLKKIIKKNHYKNNNLIKYLTFELIEFYFTKINSLISSDFFNKYHYFIKRISDTKKFNLDEESLFLEFENKILNE